MSSSPAPHSNGEAQPRPSSRLTPLLPFLIVGAGVVHGWLQEDMMRSLGKLTPLIIAAFEFACCTALSIAWLLFNRCSFHAPHAQLFKMSLLVLASLVAGNLALQWVSYPVKVVLKSTKLLPTMASTPLTPPRTCEPRFPSTIQPLESHAARWRVSHP